MQNKRSIIKSNRKHTGLLFLVLLIIFVMFFQRVIPGRFYIATIAIILWLPYIVIMFNKLVRLERTYIVVSILYLLLVLTYYILGISKINAAYFIRVFTWLFSGIISIYVIKFFSVKELKIVFVTFTIIIFLVLLLFLYFGNTSLLMMEDFETTSETWMGSIFMLLTGVFLIFLLHVKRGVLCLWFLLLFVLSVYVNFFVMQRATNVLLTGLEVLFILVFNIKRNWLVWFLSLSLLIVSSFLYFSGYLISVFEWLASVTPDRVSDRMQTIVYALMYGDIDAGGGSLTRRSELLKVSWETFTSSISSFMFGVGEHKGFNNVIGNHSFILDTLASYGMMGGIFLFVFYKTQFQIMSENLDRSSDRVLFLQVMVVYLFYLIRNYYGKIANSCVSFLILIYIPLAIQIIYNYKNNKYCLL